MDLLTKLLEHHVWLVGEIVDRAGGSPERLDAPIESRSRALDDDPTLRSLLPRLVGQMDMWNAAMESRAYDFAVERDESPALDPRAAHTAGPAFLGHAREVIDANRLDETFVDATCDPPRYSRTAACSPTFLTFAAHRRRSRSARSTRPGSPTSAPAIRCAGSREAA